VESVAHSDREAREGLLVTLLRSSDQIGIHAASAVSAPGGSGRSLSMCVLDPVKAQHSRPDGQIEREIRAPCLAAVFPYDIQYIRTTLRLTPS
jgi:hypothetical protein